jgi:hypothetical protein
MSIAVKVVRNLHAQKPCAEPVADTNPVAVVATVTQSDSVATENASEKK